MYTEYMTKFNLIPDEYIEVYKIFAQGRVKDQGAEHDGSITCTIGREFRGISNGRQKYRWKHV